MIPYAQLPGRIGILHMKDVSRYCRDHHLTWDEFWRQAHRLEASVNAERPQRGAKHDTPPLLLTAHDKTTFSFYSIPLNLPSYTFGHLWLLVAEPKAKP